MASSSRTTSTILPSSAKSRSPRSHRPSRTSSSVISATISRLWPSLFRVAPRFSATAASATRSSTSTPGRSAPCAARPTLARTILFPRERCAKASRSLGATSIFPSKRRPRLCPLTLRLPPRRALRVTRDLWTADARVSALARESVTSSVSLQLKTE
eukprot:Amastigsp_a842014_136.p3 type:complete len:157 gc:universal Amastigsp_a842014_136:711-1181(+)